MMLPVRPLTDDQQRSNTADRRKYMAIIMAITHLLIKEVNQQLKHNHCKIQMERTSLIWWPNEPSQIEKTTMIRCTDTPEQTGIM